jgi:hypothetical protein
MSKTRAALALTMMLVGGAAQAQALTAEQYQTIAEFRAWSKLCFDAELMTPQHYANSESAIDVLLTGRRFDREFLHNKTMEIFNREVANPVDCRTIEAQGYQVQTAAGTAQRNQANERAAAAQSQREFNEAATRFGNSIPRPVWCNRIGTMTMCN